MKTATWGVFLIVWFTVVVFCVCRGMLQELAKLDSRIQVLEEEVMERR